MISKLVARIAVCTVTGCILSAPASATDKKPSPSQRQYNTAVAKAKASMAQKQNARAASVAEGGSATSGGDSIDGSWGFSYTDIPASVPQGVISYDAAILSDSWKIGPLGGHASQELSLTPDGMIKLGAALHLASTYDGTEEGKARALDMAAVICTQRPDLARTRFGDKCDDLGSIFPVENAK